MLGILILQKNIHKELQKFIKKLVKHITNPEEITQKDKEFISDLDFDGIENPVQEKDFNKIGKKNNICINVFGYENELVFPIYVSDQKLEDSIDFLLLIDDDKSHYVYIKDLCFTKEEIKIKIASVEVVYNVLVEKICWENIKKIVWALMINNQ